VANDPVAEPEVRSPGFVKTEGVIELVVVHRSSVVLGSGVVGHVPGRAVEDIIRAENSQLWALVSNEGLGRVPRDD